MKTRFQSLRPIKVASLLASIAFLSTSAYSGTLFLTEGFDYADGQLTDSDAGAGANVSGGNWTGHSGTTFDDNVAVIGGKAQVRNSGSEDVNRMIGTTMGAGDTFYFAAQLAVNFTGTAGDAINNDYFIHFMDAGFGFRARVYLDDPNVAGGDYTLGLSASSGGQVAKWGSDLSFGATQQLVGSYAFDTGETKLWVNPTDESSTFITDTAGDGVEVSAIALRQDFVGGTPNNEILVDTIAVGDDFASAFGGLTVIPEPSAALLLLCGSSLLAFNRRRR